MKGTKVLYKRVSKYSNKNEMIKKKIKKMKFSLNVPNNKHIQINWGQFKSKRPFVMTIAS